MSKSVLSLLITLTLCAWTLVVQAGQPFPKPQYMVQTEIQHYLDARAFSFHYQTGSQVCDLVTVAFNRYYKIIFNLATTKRTASRRAHRRWMKKSSTFRGELLKRLTVSIKLPCEQYPNDQSDESYTLEIVDDFGIIRSNTLWGTLRGLETFSQLVTETDDEILVVNDTLVVDYPRFNHRGFLLDTSRHFLSTSIIKTHLEAMAANKMNVFHWHIVDDQSFPYQSYLFPDLSDKGAYDPFNHVYTSEDVKEIIEFARLRGIRVIPEFDSPGHTRSWGKSLPILTPCYNGSQPNGEFGPIDPTNSAVYDFWRVFLKELISVFPDKYLHLGGDEVDFGCWKSNPNINSFMKKMGFGADYSKLEQYYEQKLLDIIDQVNPSTQYVVWQEVIDNNVTVKPKTVIEIWKGGWEEETDKVTSLGYKTILSSCWYLDYISYGDDWTSYYKCEPFNFNGTDQQKELIIGGEACLWGEYVDGTNVISRAWPRGSAVAERLWSSINVTSMDDARVRMSEQRCRMIKRGISAQPINGPGYCGYEID